MFSKACEYGIRSVIFIAERSLSDRKVSLKVVAKAIDSPEAYTSKILQLLSRNRIIASEKGSAGGYFMSKTELEKVTLSGIVFAIDGDNVYNGCGLGLKECDEKMPCPLHSKFKIIRDELKDMLETTTVVDLAQGISEGLSFLKR